MEGPLGGVLNFRSASPSGSPAIYWSKSSSRQQYDPRVYEHRLATSGEIRAGVADLSEQLRFETLTVAGHRYLWLTGMLRWAFEIELPIVKQDEFELAADLGWVRHIQEEFEQCGPNGSDADVPVMRQFNWPRRPGVQGPPSFVGRGRRSVWGR